MKDAERDDLFRRARGGGAPTSEDRARVRAAVSRRLGVAVGATVGATAAAKASASLTTASAGAATVAPSAALAVAGVSALGVAKGVAVLALAVAVGYAALPKRPVAPARSLRETAVNPTPAPGAVPSLAPVVDRVPSPATAAAPPARVGSSIAPAGRPSAEAPSVTSGEELALLAAMQLALKNGENERALALAKDHELRFPTSAWAQEREGARVLATCGEGAGIEASRLGEAFLRTYPSSPLRARVRAACRIGEK